MSRTQVRVVIGLVIALHVALGLFFAPIGALDIEAETWLDRGYVACGAIVAQPVLLALWAALAPQPLAVRLPRAFELSALVCLALACGGTLNMGARMGGALETALVWGAIFSTALAALSLPRFFGWRIASEGDGDRMESRNQFTLRRLLGWTLRVSFLAAALRWLDGPVTA
ncbi:MAG TPA: hypothetical protein VG125_32290, partial [Pirellulales bacterium]|nr:hypothetical protein [Pirellulales bacterium]